ncbi:hypothetical protein Dimus_019816 [Dionaea muscipula]
MSSLWLLASLQEDPGAQSLTVHRRGSSAQSPWKAYYRLLLATMEGAIARRRARCSSRKALLLAVLGAHYSHEGHVPLTSVPHRSSVVVAILFGCSQTSAIGRDSLSTCRRKKSPMAWSRCSSDGDAAT